MIKFLNLTLLVLLVCGQALAQNEGVSTNPERPWMNGSKPPAKVDSNLKKESLVPANPERPWMGSKPPAKFDGVKKDAYIDDVIGGPVGHPNPNPIGQPLGVNKRDKYGTDPGPVGGTISPKERPTQQPVDSTGAPEDDPWVDTRGLDSGTLLNYADTPWKPEKPNSHVDGGSRPGPAQVYPGGPEINVPPETRRSAIPQLGGQEMPIPPQTKMELNPAFWENTAALWNGLSAQQKQQMLQTTLVALATYTAYRALSQKKMAMAARRALSVLGPVGLILAGFGTVEAAEQAAQAELKTLEVDDFFSNYDHASAMIEIHGADMLNFYEELSANIEESQE